MSVRGTLALAVLVAVVAGYLLTTSPRPTEAPPAPLVPPSLQVTTIRISRGDTILLDSTHDPTGWSDPRARDFMTALASLPVISVIEATTGSPLTYGFRPDALRLRLQDAAARVLEIEVGGPNPAGTGVYVRRSDGAAVLLTGSLLRWELEKLRSVTPATSVP